MLSDAIPGGDSDLLYTGESGDSKLSMQYYRNKAVEFQAVLNALDVAQSAARNALEADIDDDLSIDLYDMLQEFEGKRVLLTTTARAINLGAEAINALGGRFPQLSVPSGLGFLPVLPLAAVAAIATAAALIIWGNTWLGGLNERLRIAQLLVAAGQVDPAKAAALAHSLAMSDSARKAAEVSPLSNIAGMVKWAALGFGAYLVWKAWNDSKRGGR